MSAEREFATHIVDLLKAFGHCTARRVSGGNGIFHRGQMFALIADSNRCLKADAESRDRFLAAGSNALAYTRQEGDLQLARHLAPDELFEDGASPGRAHFGFDAVLRNPTKPRKRRT